MMKKYRKISIIAGIILVCFQIHAQQRVSGFVKDASSGEFLIGATVFDTETKNGVVTNQNGFFSLIIKPNTMLRISFLGYEPQRILMFPAMDSVLQILLKPAQTALPETEITAQYRPTFNVAKLNTSEILSIPSLSGKPDVLKALQFMPGMRSQGEASSVTLVRGGNPGENLYLLDHTPLIYVHHIGGYMSVFNPDMINDIEVYKGGFPAKYGEKLSSIMNITQKNGDQSAFRGSYSIGLTDVSLTLEGPTKLENSSFIITARKTLIDFYYLLITGVSDMTDAYLMYGFHDINGKYTWSPNQRNTFSLNVYQGDDYLQLFNKKRTDGRFRKGNIWGNTLASLNWNHLFPSNLMVKNTLSFTHYRLKDVIKIIPGDKQVQEDGAETLHNKMQSGMQDISLRSDASYVMKPNWDLDFGLKLSYLRFKPMTFTHNTVGIADFRETINAFESAIYVSSKIKPINFLDVDLGLRGVSYVNSNITNFSAEPRLSVNLYLNPNHSLNLSGMRVSQNAQLISNMGSLTANEIYVPSGKDIPVSYSNQFSFGYHASFFKKKYELEANIYHKKLTGLTTYRDGYGYTMGDIYWREKLVTGGKGLAQGFEFLFKKTKGKWTGFLGYTYSKSTRQYDAINNGKTYDFEYDSPHNLSINLAFQISEKWSFGATWQYQTGLPYTPAIGRHVSLHEDDILPDEVLIYGDKNSARMQAYHRLDIAFKKRKYTRRGHRKAEWSFGVYNVYNRQNPYFYYYGKSKYGEWYFPSDPYEPVKQYQISMFPIIPMISYKAWFGADSKEW